MGERDKRVKKGKGLVKEHVYKGLMDMDNRWGLAVEVGVGGWQGREEQ